MERDEMKEKRGEMRRRAQGRSLKEGGGGQRRGEDQTGWRAWRRSLKMNEMRRRVRRRIW